MTMKQRAFTTIDWRKYLDPNENPRVKRFLDARGFEVMNQISQNIHKGGTLGWEEVAILVHPNAAAISLVPENEYIEALDHCLEWFKDNEEYEMCAKMVKYKTDILNRKNKIKNRKVIKKLI
jgi:hypothetical protein